MASEPQSIPSLPPAPGEVDASRDWEDRRFRLLTAMSLLVRNEALTAADTRRMARETTRMGAMTLDVRRVSVWYFVAGGSAIHCADLYDASCDDHFEGTRLWAGDYPAYFAEIVRGKIVAADDALHDPRTQEFTEGYLLPLGITSMLDVPIRLGAHYVGVICYEHTGPARTWQPEERQFALFQSSLLSLAHEITRKLGQPDPFGEDHRDRG